MKLYTRMAGSHWGSSALFGGAFFLTTLPAEGLVEALAAGAFAAGSWFAAVPLLRRLAGGEPA